MRPAGPFVLSIQDLVEGETHLERVGSGADLEIDPTETVLSGPVILRARVFRAGQKIEVQGTLQASLEMTCDRCLDPVPVSLRVPLRVFAERQGSRDRRSLEEVREEDTGIVYHDGQFVVLTDEVRQDLLVEVPWHVLCSQRCLGLCPRCGVNRNRERCDCAASSYGKRGSLDDD